MTYICTQVSIAGTCTCSLHTAILSLHVCVYMNSYVHVYSSGSNSAKTANGQKTSHTCKHSGSRIQPLPTTVGKVYAHAEVIYTCICIYMYVYTHVYMYVQHT